LLLQAFYTIRSESPLMDQLNYNLSGGDHTIYLGQVEQIQRSNRRPLVFGGGKYLVADTHTT
jgi:hypothetical protein